MPIEFSIEGNWIKEKTDLRKCSACKETIYSSMYIFSVKVGGTDNKTETGVCESCYNALNG